MADSGQDNPPKRVIFHGRWNGIARLPLQQFAHSLVEDVSKGGEFACLVTNDEEMAALNANFRGKPETTDVLSFPSADPASYLGDIAISAPRARLQARVFGHAVEDEIRVLMLHGLLHLLGMDHETDKGTMRRAESRWRRHFHLPSGLIARSK